MQRMFGSRGGFLVIDSIPLSTVIVEISGFVYVDFVTDAKRGERYSAVLIGILSQDEAIRAIFND